jgi:hypothetical protein
MDSVASSLSTLRIKIARKNLAGVDAVLKAGDRAIDRINVKILQKNFKFS